MPPVNTPTSKSTTTVPSWASTQPADRVLGQIVMANFSNPEGLASQGDNVWQETGASGQPRVGLSGGGGFGKLTSGALESSNVDLSGAGEHDRRTA